MSLKSFIVSLKHLYCIANFLETVLNIFSKKTFLQQHQTSKTNFDIHKKTLEHASKIKQVIESLEL